MFSSGKHISVVKAKFLWKWNICVHFYLIKCRIAVTLWFLFIALTIFHTKTNKLTSIPYLKNTNCLYEIFCYVFTRLAEVKHIIYITKASLFITEIFIWQSYLSGRRVVIDINMSEVSDFYCSYRKLVFITSFQSVL